MAIVKYHEGELAMSWCKANGHFKWTPIFVHFAIVSAIAGHGLLQKCSFIRRSGNDTTISNNIND